MNTISTAKPLNHLISATGKKIISHFTNNQVAGKLMSMGILPGSRVELVRKAPLGGGWYVKIDRQIIALRKDELDCIVMRKW